jgi:hypothetical protein
MSVVPFPETTTLDNPDFYFLPPSGDRGFLLLAEV